MKCEEFQAAFLSGEEGEAEMRHVAGCATCRSDQVALDGARRLLADAALWEDPDPGLEDRVVGLLARSTRRSEEPTPGRRWRTSLVAALAAGLVVVGVAVWSLVGTPGADWKVPLPGTAEAPGAIGVVEGWNEPTGTKVVLSVEGLSPAPEGSVYEFWFSQAELHVSAGTFTGPGEVELWVGVSRGAFPRLWVTLEPIDEDETPSGVTVLDTES